MPILIVVGILVLIVIWLVSLYNGLVRLRNRRQNAFADIDVQLRQRHDLVPQLVETVKGYAAHEKELLLKVTEARTAAMAATTIDGKIAAEQQLSSALQGLKVQVEAYPDFYTKDSVGNFVPPIADWADVIDLNYDNKQLWSEMTNALKYWVKEFNIDGYRCDVAGMVPIEFWNQVRYELDNIKPVFMLAEWETPELHEKAFEMTYAWETHRMMNDIYKGSKTANDFKKLILSDQIKFQDYAFRMQFTSNHDENTWNGTEFERLGEAVEMFAVLTYVIPGMPLIYNGQEVGLNRRLEFFEKDLIDWKESKFTHLYSQLNQLKKTNKALLNKNFGSNIDYISLPDNKNIFGLIRENGEDMVIAIFNMSQNDVEINVNLNEINGLYTDFINNSQIEIKGMLTTNLQAWSYRLFYKN